MLHQQKQILLGVRVPFQIKEQLFKYCMGHGVKMGYFVAEAIKEKLMEMEEDNRIAITAQERLTKSKFISQKEFDKYLRKRGIKS